MYRKLSRIRSSHTCTCARFLHIGDVDACAVERLELGQMNKPIERYLISFRVAMFSLCFGSRLLTRLLALLGAPAILNQ